MLALAWWVLFRKNFRPQQETEASLGGGQTIHSGPPFTRLRYVHVPCLSVSSRERFVYQSEQPGDCWQP